MTDNDKDAGRLTKPARLRVFELPAERVGEYRNVPFALVFDRLSSEQVGYFTREVIANFKQGTGASAVLAFAFEIDLELM